MTEQVLAVFHRWGGADERGLVLQVVQPALVGLIDGTVSTLAPIFASAYLWGSHTALFGRDLAATRREVPRSAVDRGNR